MRTLDRSRSSEQAVVAPASRQRQREVDSLRRLIPATSPATSLEEDSEGMYRCFRTQPLTAHVQRKTHSLLATGNIHGARASTLHRPLAPSRWSLPKARVAQPAVLPQPSGRVWCPFRLINECNLGTKRWNDLECAGGEQHPPSPFWLMLRCIAAFPDGPDYVADQCGGHGIDDR